MKTLDRMWILAALFAVTMTLWDTPLVYPIKVLVVFFHEASHGLAAMATGGRIEHILLDPNLGGLMTSTGGWPLVILPAGYLGSMFCGAALVLGAAWTSQRRALAFLVGLALLIVTLLYVRSLFGFVSGLLFGGLLCLAGARLSEAFNDLLLSFLGVTSMLYALLDIRDDLIVRTVPQSDAAVFSNYIPLPPMVWGAIWGLLALVVAVKVLFLASGPPPWRKKAQEG
jgi:hypothetical protein